ncbi:MAG: GHKL domain-containing protein [Eubacterium sp.]|nr:GHKL domain-containing protein [Eubacterium sp.]
MITMIVREYEVNAKITMKQDSYDNLKEYMTQIENLYQNIRVFRHDYANIMASMSVYLNNNDLEGLKAYYEKNIFPINRLLNKEKDTISRLSNLESIELKGLMSVKINYALELNIAVNLEITERIENINMNTLDLVRITGILLDNAIEACQECANPCIGIGMIRTDQGVTFIVRNTYVKKELDYSSLGNLGITSKGERRGIGLYNIRSIIKKYNNVVLDTEYEGQYFTQMMEIYEEGQ